MKSHRSFLLPAVSLLVVGVTVSAAAADLDDPRNRFRAGAKVGFNLDVDFSSRGGDVGARLGPPAGGGIDRTYRDGFVRVDASGNTGGKTWYWKYNEASQVTPDGSGIAMHGYSGNPFPDVTGQSDDPQWGAEFAYTRILGEWAGALWGLELGFDWLTFNVEDDSAAAGSVTAVTDTFGLDGVVPPAAPYTGTFDGPGPLLRDSPTTRLAVPTGTTVLGTRQLEGDLYTIKFGPMVDIPLGDWLSAQVSGGLAVTLFDGAFAYSESASLPGGGTWVHSGEASSDEWLFGGYVRGQVSVRLSERVGVYAAIDYLVSESYDVSTPAREASADLGGAVFFSAGVSLGF